MKKVIEGYVTDYGVYYEDEKECKHKELFHYFKKSMYEIIENSEFSHSETETIKTFVMMYNDTLAKIFYRYKDLFTKEYEEPAKSYIYPNMEDIQNLT